MKVTKQQLELELNIKREENTALKAEIEQLKAKLREGAKEEKTFKYLYLDGVVYGTNDLESIPLDVEWIKEGEFVKQGRTYKVIKITKECKR